MKSQSTGEPDGCESSRTFSWVPCFIALALLAITVCLCLLGVLAMAELVGAIWDGLDSLSLGFLAIATSISLILSWAWSALEWLLTLLGWLVFGCLLYS